MVHEFTDFTGENDSVRLHFYTSWYNKPMTQRCSDQLLDILLATRDTTTNLFTMYESSRILSWPYSYDSGLDRLQPDSDVQMYLLRAAVHSYTYYTNGQCRSWRGR